MSRTQFRKAAKIHGLDWAVFLAEANHVCRAQIDLWRLSFVQSIR